VVSGNGASAAVVSDASAVVSGDGASAATAASDDTLISQLNDHRPPIQQL
jgi:hypothetical protein